jgi:hypothetical protein
MLHIARKTALVAAAVLLAAPVAAENRKMHKEASTAATHHVVVGVTEVKSGAPVGDARVMLELVDPRGGVQRKTLERGDAGGVPDYSGLFRFGWGGAYKLRVSVTRAGASPVTTTFAWNQEGY